MSKIFTRAEIEDMVLGMASAIQENRFLRRENNYLQLQVAKYNAFTSTLVCSTPKAKRKYEILCELEKQNSQARFHEACGFETSEIYLYDWEEEVERRLKQEGFA